MMHRPTGIPGAQLTEHYHTRPGRDTGADCVQSPAASVQARVPGSEARLRMSRLAPMTSEVLDSQPRRLAVINARAILVVVDAILALPAIARIDGSRMVR